MSRLRVAVVVQRYGVDVNGGSEYLARVVAEALCEDVDITVVTTCALDYVTWANHYPPGASEVNGVAVLRFPVTRERTSAFAEVTGRAYAEPDDVQLGKEWIRAQGPDSPALLEHLASSSYDVFLFFTYLYATSALGIPLVADRAVLVPTAHDEPPLKLRVFDEIYKDARLLLCITPEEQRIIERRFGIAQDRFRLMHIGVEHVVDGDPARFRHTTGIESPFALVVGRLDASKGVTEVIDDHALYRELHPRGLDLVLIGRGDLELPSVPWLRALGFVDEQLKHDAIAAATAVVLPSPYESLSLSQLEAWEHGRPTLANARSDVLVGQSRRSGGGLWYTDGHEYSLMLDALAGMPAVADAIGRQGKRFTNDRYRWDRAKQGWLDALSAVAPRA